MLGAPLKLLLVLLGFFAGWTVASNVATLGALPVSALWIAYGMGLYGAVLGWRATDSIFRIVTSPELRLAPARLEQFSPMSAQRIGVLLVASVLIAGSGAYFVKTGSVIPFWATCLFAAAWSWAAGLGGGKAQITHRSTPDSAPVRSRLLLAAYFALIFGLYLFTNAPDGDDAFYLNLPIGIKSAEAGMLIGDTVLGDPGWPLLGSNYRAESLPTLTAALSAATGIPVIYVAHLVLPAIWCLVFACALYVISYALFGRHWAWCAFAYLFILTGLGFSYQGYGAHGVARLYHGKAIFVSILAPLIVFLTYAALRLRSVHAAIASGCVQICALGATANAIYLAPLCSGLVAAAWFFGGPDRRRAVLILLASSYNLLVGVYLVLFDKPVPYQTPVDTIDGALWSMFTSKSLMALFMGVTGAAALLGAATLRGRFASLYAAAFLLFVLNPFLWEFYSKNVTGALNFRLFWVAPFALFLAVAIGLFSVSVSALPRAALLIAALAFAVGPDSSLRRASFGVAPIKVDVAAFAAARWANEAAPGRVLAATPVASLVPTLERRAPLVFARPDYLEQQRSQAPSGEVDRRLALQAWIDGAAPMPPNRLNALARRYCVASIVFDSRSSRAAEIESEIHATLRPGEFSDFGPYRAARVGSVSDPRCAAGVGPATR